jgi:precorrin-2 dehydrogenase / sirohydrochlorin ferrochelatase
MTKNYPIMLRLDGKKVVIIGGGKVAARKVTGLLKTGAQIIVISPDIIAELKQLATDGKIEWQQKSFSEDDIKGAFMIFAATNDEEINRLVKRVADEHQLVTVADDPDGSDFHVPAHLQRGRLSIAISTGGASPTLANKLREQLEQQFNGSYEEYLEFLFTARQWILREVEDPSIKRKLLTAIVSPEFFNREEWEEDFRRLYEEMI